MFSTAIRQPAIILTFCLFLTPALSVLLPPKAVDAILAGRSHEDDDCDDHKHTHTRKSHTAYSTGSSPITTPINTGSAGWPTPTANTTLALSTLAGPTAASSHHRHHSHQQAHHTDSHSDADDNVCQPTALPTPTRPLYGGPRRRNVEHFAMLYPRHTTLATVTGTAVSGGPPSGTGTAASGWSPSGTAPSGTAPSGTAPSGTAPSGTAPSGTVSSGYHHHHHHTPTGSVTPCKPGPTAAPSATGAYRKREARRAHF